MCLHTCVRCYAWDDVFGCLGLFGREVGAVGAVAAGRSPVAPGRPVPGLSVRLCNPGESEGGICEEVAVSSGCRTSQRFQCKTPKTVGMQVQAACSAKLRLDEMVRPANLMFQSWCWEYITCCAECKIAQSCLRLASTWNSPGHIGCNHFSTLIRHELRFFSEAPRADSSMSTAVIFPKESDTAEARAETKRAIKKRPQVVNYQDVVWECEGCREARLRLEVPQLLVFLRCWSC